MISDKRCAVWKNSELDSLSPELCSSEHLP